jgi:hypothetical protein
MSKLVKIAILLGAAVFLIAAKQVLPLRLTDSATSSAARTAISPAEMMRMGAPLPELVVDSYF